MFRDPVQSTISHTETAINKIDPMGLIGLSVAAIVVLSVLAFALHIWYKFRKRNGNGHGKSDLDIVHQRIDKLNDKFEEHLIPLIKDVSYIRAKIENK